MARRTRKKGNINNVINTAPPIVLAIVYLKKDNHHLYLNFITPLSGKGCTLRNNMKHPHP